jgi:RHS repeat-associated protein
MCWNAKWSLASNQFVKEMLSDPAVANRDELPKELFSNATMPVSGLPMEGNWKLTFEDTFDGDELDSSKWIPSYEWGQTHNYDAYCDTVDVAEFFYDALGRRICKVDWLTETGIVYYNNDNWQVLCEYDAFDGAFEQWYAYGNYIDEVLIKGTFYAASCFQYYLHDHLYSPVAITSWLGAPVERYEYDAYGNPHVLDPTTYAERPISNSLSRYLFTGRELDILDYGSLKIQYNRNRYYDSYTGRWTTQDPLGITPNPESPNRFAVTNQYSDGLNLYEHVGSNPVAKTDAYGLRAIDETGCVIACLRGGHRSRHQTTACEACCFGMPEGLSPLAEWLYTTGCIVDTGGSRLPPRPPRAPPGRPPPASPAPLPPSPVDHEELERALSCIGCVTCSAAVAGACALECFAYAERDCPFRSCVIGCMRPVIGICAPMCVRCMGAVDVPDTGLLGSD